MKLTMIDFGRNGRLGNMMFQWASMLGIAKEKGMDVVMPANKMGQYFEKYNSMVADIPLLSGLVPVKEKHFHYHDIMGDLMFPADVAIERSYLQSEKYFSHCEEYIRNTVKFKKEFIIDCLAKVPAWVFSKPTIAIHIRRGDYMGNRNYTNLPISYYITALEKHFPNWRAENNLVLFSDDINYCKAHFQCIDNVYFSTGNNDVQDMCLMSQCTHFIIANSSYSWWGAWLGEIKGGKVVRPTHHFEGPLKERSDIKDLYPSRWISHDHKEHKIDLSDVTFTIPVFYDHEDRNKNLSLCVCMLQHNFNTNIVVGEQGGNRFAHMSNFCRYMNFSVLRYFHRTKMLNDMARVSYTPFIANWDADVFIMPLQILEAVRAMRNGKLVVYPYDWRFGRMRREDWFSRIEKEVDLGVVGTTKFTGMNDGDAVSFGGAVMFNRQAYWSGGGENENFISFGPEDSERRDRFMKLGYEIYRQKGPLYHMNHFVGINSGKKHPWFRGNRAEYNKVAGMTPNELSNYIKTWHWLKK